MARNPLMVELPTMWRVIALLVALCAGSGAFAQQIEAPWLRAMPPGQSTAAIYLQLRNNSAQPLLLQGARVEGARSAAVHEHVHVDGMMSMRPAGVLRIEPGATLALEPGGYHLMVFGLGHTLAAGEQLQFCLQFEGGGEKCDEARVKAIGE